MRTILISTIVAVYLSASGCARDRDITLGNTADEANAFERVREAYAPYMEDDEPFSLPMKVRAISADRYSFWRGGKDLFFQWCRENVAHWLADREAYVVQQGDQHFGNIGTYLAEGPFGTLAFGMVDFDDSYRLPFQFELLQGMVSLRLAAQQNALAISEQQWRDVTKLMLDDYAAAASTTRTAAQLLGGDPRVAKMLAASARRPYDRELRKFVDANGRFLLTRATRRGELKDILHEGDHDADDIAAALAEAMSNSPELAKRFRYQGVGSIRANVMDVAVRTRLGSAGSQGLRKYFVLMHRPLAELDHDVIFYLKQQIPCAAERAGVASDDRQPGQRCAEDIEKLSRPRPYLSGWCRIDGQSYWLTVREPWSSELDPEDITDEATLRRYARIWAIATGSGHRLNGESTMIRERANSRLLDELVRFSEAYVRQLDAEYAQFRADPRARGMSMAAEEAISPHRPKP